MSDTPLTDRAEYSMYGSRLLVDADFARELERQLSAANAKIVELQGRLIAQENNLEKKELESQLQSAHLKILDLQGKLILISRIVEPSYNFSVRG